MRPEKSLSGQEAEIYDNHIYIIVRHPIVCNNYIFLYRTHLLKIT